MIDCRKQWLKRAKRAKLYDPAYEHDACGTGFVAHLSGKRSHDLVEKAVDCVVNLTHRGAVGADALTGDGAGILTQIPHALFDKLLKAEGKSMPAEEDFAVGVIFFPKRNHVARERARSIIEDQLVANGFEVIHWRVVPIDASVVGVEAQNTCPQIEQVLIARGHVKPAQFEPYLYLTRKQIENRVAQDKIEDFYIPSFSSRTIVYKGLLVAPQLRKFYLDLNDKDYVSSLAVFHQRYSTNTFPNWVLAQPFRYLGHNGEINTLRGNINWMRAREGDLKSEVWGDKIEDLKPIIQPNGSDSATFDNVLELLINSGRNILQAMMMLIPEAWDQVKDLEQHSRGFYQYHECLTEAWDGPAAMAFTDGKMTGAALDRNGLRPARYVVTEDDLVIMGSETGMISIPESKIVKKGRLGPGRIIAIDPARGKLLTDNEIKQQVGSAHPYLEWCDNILPLEQIKPKEKIQTEPRENSELLRIQTLFGCTSDEVEVNVLPMAKDGKEPVGSMGDDIPLSVLSKKAKSLYTYFKQLFAQVTNPPIDPIRETCVMTLSTYLGRRGNLLEESPEHASLLHIHSPVILNRRLQALKELKGKFQSRTLDAVFPVKEGKKGLKAALDRLSREAQTAVREDVSILILSDQKAGADFVPIPMLLAVGTVHHHLVQLGQRMRASIVAEAGDIRDVHQLALLIGYGANAVNPYLSLETVARLAKDGKIKDVDEEHALVNYKKALELGLLKIMSKMGISTVSSYCGAQIFEAVGLNDEVIHKSFIGTASRISGIGFEQIAQDALWWHELAFQKEMPKELVFGGYYRYRKNGEYHGFNPDVFRVIHKLAVSGKEEDFKELSAAATNHPPVTIRDLLRFKKLRKPIPVEEVETVEEIRKKFVVSGMSHGSLSSEVHECVHTAANRVGAKGSSGEGGEHPRRFKPLPNGDSANCEIKQVASGRFGVTTEYLIRCKEHEIKIAQGAKPGEGGQLPGHKVTPEIALIRHSKPGVTLISPPPHHDIYSIEDLAQLIYDLKMVNKGVRVNVKLVAEVGVGTIAAGVAKGHADRILISGHDGGTGASPVSSIKYAGLPWELGLAETQQVLMVNGLRDRVKLRTDGGIKCGRDIVIAALLGAEEYGLGSSTLIAAGCVMARVCHLNTCPVGVATQKEELRAKFPGKVERVVNYFNALAWEVRQLLAELGFKTLEEAIGRVEFLEQVPIEGYERTQLLDLKKVLADVDPENEISRKNTWDRNDWNDQPLDDTIVADAGAVIKGKGTIQLSYPIKNTDRTVGARISGEIAKIHGIKGLPVGSIECRFAGTAGQSFGAFCIDGVRLMLMGEANDYVGKGMSGGEIIVRTHPDAEFKTHENVIIGNTVMYGATKGTLYAAGCAGERFCVRNSGGNAVVEGVGDHGCEYMTGGTVVILGETGRNFGAGMSNGVVYVLDEKNQFDHLYNPQMLQIARLEKAEDIAILKNMISQHFDYTQSPRAKDILDQWEHYQPMFWKVSSKDITAPVGGKEPAVTAKAF